YKPYPCGIVAHPVIDGCLALREECDINAIQQVELRVHPLVLMLMGNGRPTTGLEAKLSVQHCVAAAFIVGEVGLKEFTEACVLDPAIVNLRARVVLIESDNVPKQSASISVKLTDGSKRDIY